MLFNTPSKRRSAAGARSTTAPRGGCVDSRRSGAALRFDAQRCDRLARSGQASPSGQRRTRFLAHAALPSLVSAASASASDGVAGSSSSAARSAPGSPSSSSPSANSPRCTAAARAAGCSGISRAWIQRSRSGRKKRATLAAPNPGASAASRAPSSSRLSQRAASASSDPARCSPSAAQRRFERLGPRARDPLRIREPGRRERARRIARDAVVDPAAVETRGHQPAPRPLGGFEIDAEIPDGMAAEPRDEIAGHHVAFPTDLHISEPPSLPRLCRPC